MNNYKINEKIECRYDEGIWLDYDNSNLIIFIKDAIFNDLEEVKRLLHSNINLKYVEKDNISLFLLSIYDCLETSDIPFFLNDFEENLKNELLNTDIYTFSIIGIDNNNIIKGIRICQLSDKNSNILKLSLRKQDNAMIDSDMFDIIYENISNEFEPFELEPFACFEENFK